jgi:hypothetical protein
MGKGDQFERDQSRLLSLWFTDGERDDIFWRRRVRRTRESPDGKHQLGDLASDDPVGFPLTKLFNIELKSGYSKSRKGKTVKNIPWDLLDIIDYGEGRSKRDPNFVLLDFWKQTSLDAELSGRIPLLIFHRDYHSAVVCVEMNTLLLIEDHVGLPKFPTVWLNLSDYGTRLVFVREEFFLSWLRPEVVIAMYNERKS